MLGWRPDTVGRAMKTVITVLPGSIPEHELVDNVPSLRTAILYSDHIHLLVPQTDDVLESDQYRTIETLFPETLTFDSYSEFDRVIALDLGTTIRASARHLGADQSVVDALLASVSDYLDRPYLEPAEMLKRLRSVRGFPEGLERVVNRRHEVLLDVAAETTEAARRTDAFPILDDVASVLSPVARQEVEGRLGRVMTDRSRQASLSHDLVWRIPAVETASLSELADVRAELTSPLVRFRSAVARLRSDIHSTPLDPPEFVPEVQGAYEKTVEPALLEIRELIDESRYLREVFRAATQDPKSALAAGMSFAAATVVDISSLFAAAVGVATPLASAARQRKSALKKAETNDFFFIHAVSTALDSPVQSGRRDPIRMRSSSSAGGTQPGVPDASLKQREAPAGAGPAGSGPTGEGVGQTDELNAEVDYMLVRSLGLETHPSEDLDNRPRSEVASAVDDIRSSFVFHLKNKRWARRAFMEPEVWEQLDGLIEDVLILRIPATRLFMPVVLVRSAGGLAPLVMGAREGEENAHAAARLFCQGIAEARTHTMESIPSTDDEYEVDGELLGTALDGWQSEQRFLLLLESELSGAEIGDLLMDANAEPESD
jgi:hypothetical protein